MADLLGSDFSLAGERICGGSLITFCSAALTTKSEFWLSAVTIALGYTSTPTCLELTTAYAIGATSGTGQDVFNALDPNISPEHVLENGLF